VISALALIDSPRQTMTSTMTHLWQMMIMMLWHWH